MRLRVLIENTAGSRELRAEHGLSLFLETENHAVLFDMGQSGAFRDNARTMGVDLQTADLAVLSHGHYDHGGGLKTFLEENPTAPVYVSRHAFAPCWHGAGKYIGLDRALEASPRLILTGEKLVLDEGLSLHGCNGREPLVPIDSAGLTREEQGTPDDFRHEQYLLVREGGKRVLFTGCSHKGVENLAHWFRPDVLVGGFHLRHLDPETEEGARRLEEKARTLLSYPTEYYTCHCTGEKQYRFLKEIMGARLHSLTTGACIIL